jgi:hypothetical protein
MDGKTVLRAALDPCSGKMTWRGGEFDNRC